ncbi:SpoIIE family protein phosphatase [Candidatus Parabeggiatoa sp. HSG14]|uniref:PP2C family protein-serine/threonine phosphatase n=1 Tax=Candidatus Parabeggiatoa sp. HSG14 TaxID=3055593 RepID=UPI0025A9306F|nr:SpoIIE family protein phosphatase [Thiotrichales bacterium HSG14]
MTNNINNNNLSDNEDDDKMSWIEEDDELVWAEEDVSPTSSPDENQIAAQNILLTGQDEWISHDATTWKVMVVDDEPEIHDVIRFALDGFIFQEKALNLIFASSGEEAKSLLKKHPDTALIFLDVVMEKNDTGLQLVKYIRNTLQQFMVRIILHTGQPGEVPEESVIENYDINDYKLKSEMTQGKLLVAAMAGLRGYRDLLRLERNKIELSELYSTVEQKVVERTAQLAQANTQIKDANEEITALYEQLQSENLRMRAELDVSRRLQQMLLPPPTELSQIEGLEIAGFLEPAAEVGGDYYDVQQRGNRVLCGIGDVTGHGLESGVLAIMTQTAVKTLLANNETDSVKFLTSLNETIYHNVQRMNSDKNLTFALLDYQNGQIRVTGQHEEIIVVRSGEVELIDTIDLGFPIGLDDNIADFISEAKISLNTGDVVVLYTDGITEAINPDKVQYGLERLCEVIQQHWQQTAQEIQQAVIEDVRQFIGTQKVYDDITLLVLKQK